MISVCIATYNGAAYIREQLDSILSQLGPGDEVIISDDGSTDGTLSVLDSYSDPRIKVLNHVKGKRYPHAADYTTHNFEHALRHAKGETVFLSDQDDVWLPDKVAVMCESLRENLLAVADCTVTDGELRVLYPSYFEIHRTRSGVWNNLYINAFVGSSMAFRRELLDVALPFPDKDVGHDLWLGLLATCKGKVDFIRRPLVLYRRHEQTVSPTGGKSTLPLSYKIKYRLKTLAALAMRLLR